MNTFVTDDYPNSKYPLRSNNPKCDPSARLAEAFDSSGLTQQQWVEAVGLKDRSRAAAWLKSPGSMKAEQVAATLRLFDVTIEYLRYGEPERPTHDVEQEGELYFRLADARSAEGPLTPEIMRDVYIELNGRDRQLISDMAMRLYQAEQRDSLFEVTARMDEFFAEEEDELGIPAKRISRMMPELMDTYRATYNLGHVADKKER